MILWGTMMKPSAVVCPVCLANLSSSVWPSFSLLMRVGMQGSLIMALPPDWNFVKQRGAPGRPQYGRTGEDCHPPRLAAPGSCHTRNSVPVMMGVSSRSSVRVLFRGTAPESAAPTVIRIAVTMGTSRPLGAGPRAKEPTINVNISGVPDDSRRLEQLYLVKTLNAVQRCFSDE